MVKWFLFSAGALIVAEMAALIVVSEIMGLGPALVLMVATSLAGIAVLRHPGRTRIAQMHEAVAKTGIGGLKAGGDAFLTIAAGVLLLVPGFITDAAGLLLLLPPVRGWIAGRFQFVMQSGQPRPPGVVDLEQDEWNRVPERQIDDRHRTDRRP